MNLSIHLPDPLIEKLDAYAATAEKSRSSVVREAVSEYLLNRTVAAWPAELARWMSVPCESEPSADAWPNFDSIRDEANANMTQRGAST